MPLVPNRVRFSHPSPELSIDILRRFQPKGVHVIARRDRLNRAEARMLEATRQHNMSVEPVCARCNLRERHPHLESYARLLGEHSDWSDCAYRRNYFFEQRPDLGPFAFEMMRQVVPPASV